MKETVMEMKEIWEKLIRTTGIDGRTVTVDLPTENRANQLRWKFYRMRDELVNNGKPPELALAVQRIAAKVKGTEVIFEQKKLSATDEALRKALG